MTPTLNIIKLWFENNTIISIGIFLSILGFIFLLSEFRVYYKHKSSSDQLVLWSMVFLAGIVTTIANDLVLGILSGISILMVIETIKMWDAPVWGKMMAATTSTYLIIFFGALGQKIYDYVVKPADPTDFIFATAYNLAFPVFIIVSFIFFGRKFILVSKFSSPQIVYLFMFGIVYGGIISLRDKVFPVDENNMVMSYNYLNIDAAWRTRVIFADFGTFEALAVVMIFMYLISGWLLQVLMGVKPVTDPVILEKVQTVARRMGIKSNIKVGYVSAPILNAFAYGPFFDKRIAFIAGDLSEFTDEDIKGIVGHELAHTARHHVIILLLLSILELAVKKGLGFPATTLDYSFLPKEAVSNISFVGYYIFSYGLFIVLYIFVRVLEGDADMVTKQAGYSKELAQALYRLEGFYNGVASDFGISVNLLTDRRYTMAEKRRFTAQAARVLFEELISPSRGSAFANILQSHPRTVYRIASLVSDEINPRKGAFLPYRLLGFFQRKKAIKQLNSVYKEFSKLIDESYLNEYGADAINEVLEFNPWIKPYMIYINKQVISYNIMTKSTIVGIYKSIKISGRVTSPFTAIIDDKEIDLSINEIKIYQPGEKYIFKDASIMKLIQYTNDDKKGLLLEFEDDKVEISKVGVPLNYLLNLNNQNIIYFYQGISRLAKLLSIEIDDEWENALIKIKTSDTVKEYKGKDLIVTFPPLGAEIRKERIDEQLDLLKYFINKDLILYTKDNFDVSLSGKVKSVDDQILILEDADGEHSIDTKKIEYILIMDNMLEFVVSEHISAFTKFNIWWANRKQFNHIKP